jgi:hypothetical protein
MKTQRKERTFSSSLFKIDTSAYYAKLERNNEINNKNKQKYHRN